MLICFGFFLFWQVCVLGLLHKKKGSLASLRMNLNHYQPKLKSTRENILTQQMKSKKNEEV